MNGITRGGNELNVEKGLLEVGHKMKSFAHLSGSDVLFFKFNSRTDRLPNFESEAIAFFNTRNVRLLTYESGLDGSSMEYISRASYGHHEPANNQNYLNSINNIISLTVVLANDPAYIVPSIPVRIFRHG